MVFETILHSDLQKLVQVEQLTAANKRYQRQIASIGADAEGGTPRKDISAKEALAELKALAGEQQRRRLRPTDAELLDDDSPPEDRPLLAAEAKRLYGIDSFPTASVTAKSITSLLAEIGNRGSIFFGRRKPVIVPV